MKRSRVKSVKEEGRLRRHRRLRKKVVGTPERPRLVVHRSHLHLEAQVVDDLNQKTLLGCSTRGKEFLKKSKSGSTTAAAKLLGEQVGQAAQKAGIQQVVFDKGGLLFHGRVKALAEAARAQGLVF
ncbi:MAG: 50S ribosomal protein L18 [Candidatus Omnitrophica bacterium]|nr:50S ribosomal protein L18 [Candidatus Omnitrophota bacterium]